MGSGLSFRAGSVLLVGILTSLVRYCSFGTEGSFCGGLLLRRSVSTAVSLVRKSASSLLQRSAPSTGG